MDFSTVWRKKTEEKKNNKNVWYFFYLKANRTFFLFVLVFAVSLSTSFDSFIELIGDTFKLPARDHLCTF